MKTREPKEQTSITMAKDMLADLREKAKGEGRTLGNYIEQMVRKHFLQAEATPPETAISVG